jgi:hypothetical protein
MNTQLNASDRPLLTWQSYADLLEGLESRDLVWDGGVDDGRHVLALSACGTHCRPGCVLCGSIRTV